MAGIGLAAAGSGDTVEDGVIVSIRTGVGVLGDVVAGGIVAAWSTVSV